MYASSMLTASATDTTTARGAIEVKVAGWPLGKGEM
jgi:hypothetical protein